MGNLKRDDNLCKDQTLISDYWGNLKRDDNLCKDQTLISDTVKT